MFKRKQIIYNAYGDFVSFLIDVVSKLFKETRNKKILMYIRINFFSTEASMNSPNYKRHVINSVQKF